MEKDLIITNEALYYSNKAIKDKEKNKNDDIKGRIKFEDLYGITYSLESNQFIIHFRVDDDDCLYQSEERDEIVILLQKLYESLRKEDLSFCVKHEKDLSKYIITEKEKNETILCYQLDSKDLIPIKVFFKLGEEKTNLKEGNKYSKTNEENKDSKENIKIMNIEENKIGVEKSKKEKEKQNENKTMIEQILNQRQNLKAIRTNQIKTKNEIKINIIEKDDLKEIKNDQIRKIAEKIKRENNNIKVIASIEDMKDMITIYFESGDQTLKCAVLCKSNDIFNSVVNKLFEKEPQFQEGFNIFLCNGARINEYKTLKDNQIKDGSHVILYVNE